MKKIKVLIFDLDNTLINYGGVTRRAWEISVHKAMSIYPLPCKEEELVDQIVSINDALWENEALRPHGNFSFYDLRKHIVSSAFEQLSITHTECLEFLVVNYSYYKQEAIYLLYHIQDLDEYYHFILSGIGMSNELTQLYGRKKEFHSFLEKEFTKQKELSLTVEAGMFSAKKQRT